MGIIEKIFGTHSEHELKRIYPIVDHIDALEPEMQKLSDEELKEKTKEFKERLAKGETLDDLLPEAFAVVREAAVRVLGMRHYRVQMIGGIILHQGRRSNTCIYTAGILKCTDRRRGAYCNSQRLSGKA